MASKEPMSGKTRLIAAVGATAAAALVSFSSTHEGLTLVPFHDGLANQLMTVCYGETQVAMHRYTQAECLDMLQNGLAQRGVSIRAITPGFDKLTDGQKVAVVDFTYNVGIGDYARSTLRRQYSAGNFPAACEQFMRWRYVNNGRVDCAIASNRCSGIYKRRAAERAACLGG